MVKRFSEFINEEYDLELHYYAFDWDDNILHMPTVIHMDKLIDGKWTPTDVSTAEFAQVRNDKVNYRLVNNNPEEAFCEFRDTGPRGEVAFLTDVKNAISKGQFGPVWNDFKKCLSEGALFAIITARGHEPEAIRGAVEWIIDNILTEEERFLMYSNCLKHAYLFSNSQEFDRIPKGQLSQTPLVKLYLDECGFYGVSSQSFAKEFGSASAANPEHAKELALDKFIEKCNQLGRQVGAKSVSIGFSDDDPKNVEHVRKYFKEKSALANELQPHKVKLNLYKTTDRSLAGGERTKFHDDSDDDFNEFGEDEMKVFYGQDEDDFSDEYHEAADSTIAPGMASSVMPYTQFNNMADRVFTDNKEYDKSMKLGTKQLAKMSKEYVKPISKKKRKIKKTK